VSNYYGKFYGYTGLFPILRDAEGEAHCLALRKNLSELPNASGSLFSRTGLVHGARLFIIDDVVYNGHPTPVEHLQYSYLALSLTFDGELEQLSKQIAKHGGEEWDSIFSHCYAISEDIGSADSVLALLRKGQITTSFLYVDADGDLQTTLRALALQKEVALLVEEAQFLGIDAKKKMVQELSKRMADMPEAVPGDFNSEGDTAKV
jgi:hypothetical protein